MDLLGRSATRRRFLGLTFVGFASTVLAACSSGQPSTPTTSAASSSTSSSAAPTSASAAPTAGATAAATSASNAAPTAAPAANAASSSGSVTIEAWIPWQDKPSVAAFQKLLTRFEQENPKYKVNPTWGATEDKTLTAISGGSPPDSFMYWDATYVGTWAQTGAIIDISPWMTANGLQKKLTLGALRLVEVAGKFYACPYMTDGYMFMYNKDAFDKAGIKAPPATMEEVAQLSAELTKKDSNGKITQVGYHPLYDGCCSASNMGMWAMQMGGKWYDDTKKLITADDPGNVTALQWEMDFYSKYGVEAMNNFLSGLGKEATPTDPMASGMTLMAIQGEWRTGGAYGVAAANPNFKYGLAPIPSSKAHPELKNANFATGTAASIPKSAKNGQDALNLIGWILQLENQIEISNGIGNLPATLEGLGAHDKLTLEGMGPYAQYLLQSNEAGNVYAWPAIPVSKQYMDTLVKSEQLAVGGKQSAKDALKSVNQQIQPQLDAAMKPS